MAKDPAFLFYSSDFLTGTMLMSNEQVGKYIRLMCLQHQKGKLTEKDMLNICLSYDEDVFQKFAKDEHGLYHNERLSAEIQRRIDYTESRRQNRLKGNTSKSYDQHMETENENISSTNKKIIPNKEEEKPKKNQKKSTIDEAPFEQAELNSSWRDWMQFRNEIKEPLTPTAATRQISFLKKYTHQIAIQIIDRSIQNNWKGLFEIKESAIVASIQPVKKMVL